MKCISNYQGGCDLKQYQKERGENMHRKNIKNIYDEMTVKKYLSDRKPFINVSSEIEVQYKWIEGKRTDEVTGYKLFFVQEGVNPFAVKFERRKPFINVSSEIEVQYKWIEGKRTDEVTGYKLFFVQEGVNPFAVKFERKPELPKFLSEVTLEKLEAIEIRSKVYFRAESVVEKK